jgi:chromosome segregation ATPase
MSPMSDQPLTLSALTTTLVQLHREIILPDIHRIVGEVIGASERRLQGTLDGIVHKLDKLETEYQALKAGLERVEERLSAVEGRLQSLERQYDDLRASLHRLEERLSRVEAQVDVVVAAQGKDPLRAEVADLRARVDVLQLQVRNIEKRLDRER